MLLVLIAAGFLTGTVESIVWHHRQEKESLRGLFEYCSGQARSTGAELVLYDPPERTSGAANYYLKRNVRVRKDAAGYDGKSPELWILRNKRIEGGMEFADSHRVYTALRAAAGSEMSLPEAVAAAVFSRERGDSARFFVNRLEFPERRVILIIRR